MLDIGRYTQFADLGVALVCSFAEAAVTTAFAATSMAMTLPFAVASAATAGAWIGAKAPMALVETMLDAPAMPETSRTLGPSSDVNAYASYRSSGGHASAQVIFAS